MKCSEVSRVTDSITGKQLVILCDENTNRLFAIEASEFGDGSGCDIYSPYDRRMLSIEPANDALLHIDSVFLRETFGENNDSTYPRAQWLKAVASHSTDLGYWEWVSQQKESMLCFDGLTII
ncbi:hypothetical protein [Neptunomonas sp.]|jgi:hypothetical protein|uniref:hypothetical protein n=1 Tax=Neptunomonas TaxID=75687 RepID=UPI003512161A